MKALSYTTSDLTYAFRIAFHIRQRAYQFGFTGVFAATEMKASFGRRAGAGGIRDFSKTVSLFQILGPAAIGYGFLAGFRTLSEYDLGWQLVTARRITEHHQIPSTAVLSYTALGHPWIYPIGAGLISMACI